MATEATQPRGATLREILISVVLGAGVFGIVATVGGQFIVDWIRDGVEDRGLEGFWGPIVLASLAALASIAVLVLLIVSLISPKGRERWARLGTWIWSWRPVSYRRHRREMFQQNEAMLAEVGGIAEAASKNAEALRTTQLWARDAIEKVRTSIPEVSALLLDRSNKNMAAIEDLDKQVRELKGKSGPRIDFEANVRAAAANMTPTMPLPRPRWNIGPENTEDLDLYVIQNMVPRSVAREVRVEADEDMQIIDAGHWEDLSVEGPTKGHGNFTGVANERGEEHGVTITITWYDENGVKDSVAKTVFPRKPEEFKVWSTGAPATAVATVAAEPDPWDKLKNNETPF